MVIAVAGSPIFANLPAASAQETPPDQTTEAAKLLLDGRDLDGQILTTSPTLNTVELTSEQYDDATSRQRLAYTDLVDAATRTETSTAEVERLEAVSSVLSDLVERNTKRLDKIQISVDRQHDALKVVAIYRYVNSSSREIVPSPSANLNEQFESSQRVRMVSETERVIRSHISSLDSRLLERTLELQNHQSELQATMTRLKELRQAIEDADRDSKDATERLAVAEADIIEARPYADVSNSDLSFVALDAYWRAAASIDQEDPSCGLKWWGLAGIGRTESIHGRIFGAEVLPSGEVSSPIYGIALDGTNLTKVIVDSDGGAIDGDPEIDRAVGPMQFIPTTWARYRADQTGDGTADPQNLYDASLAAARYLCKNGPGLDSDEGLRRAYFSYNQSESYVELVLSRSHGYRDLQVPGPQLDQ